MLRLSFLIIGIALITVLVVAAHAQGTSPKSESASGALSRLSAAFSGGQVVQRIQLSGNATWHTGSLEDSGTVTLNASTDGSSQMQLLLAASGQKTESQAGSGLSAKCQWAGADGVAHEIHSGSCWRSALWFLPALSIQPSLLPGNLGAVDLGVGTVGASGNTYRHVQTQLTLSSLPDAMAMNIARLSTTDIGIDPVTLLPAVLAYSVRPDNGAQVAIAVEIHYSDYRVVNGVQIPFLIRRYVNGALQLEIRVSSAQIN